LDAWVDAAEATISLGVRELACRLNVSASNFEKTAANLARAAQVRVSGETLRQLIEGEGRRVLQAQRSGAVPVGWTADDCHVAEGPTRVYLGSDGVMVPTVTDTEKRGRRQKVKQKRRRRGRAAKPLPAAKAGADQTYKEFKIVTYYDETQDHRLVSATKGDCAVAGRMMRRDAARLHLDRAAEKIANVDGAAWIRNQLHRQGLPLDAIGLDFYHLAEHVHEARRLVFGDTGAAGAAWAEQLLHTFKHDGCAVAWDQLLAWRAALRSPRQRQAADQLLHYVSERQEMIAYPAFLANGWQIGSGPTEAMCKTTTARLKHSGMRWDQDNAEAIMALACLEQSGQWQLYWQTQYQLAA
jgi:hypothetical protein